MIDIADLLRALPPEAKVAATARLSKMVPNVVAFAIGCAAGAFIYSRFAMWCFVVPPILAAVPVMMNATKEEV